MVVQFGKFSQNKFSQHCAVALPPAATKSSFSWRARKSADLPCVFRSRSAQKWRKSGFWGAKSAQMSAKCQQSVTRMSLKGQNGAHFAEQLPLSHLLCASSTQVCVFDAKNCHRLGRFAGYVFSANAQASQVSVSTKSAGWGGLPPAGSAVRFATTLKNTLPSRTRR